MGQRTPVYGSGWKRQRIDLTDLDRPQEAHGFYPGDADGSAWQAFGYTVETMQIMLQPLVTELRDPLGSMGNDAALAVMSEKPRMLYDYFKQRFAQVTNPAIDSIREEVIMALNCYVGPEQNLLEATEEHCHRLRVPHPILSNEELAPSSTSTTAAGSARPSTSPSAGSGQVRDWSTRSTASAPRPPPRSATATA